MPLAFTKAGATDVQGLTTASNLHDLTIGTIVIWAKPTVYPDGTAIKGMFNSNGNAGNFRAFNYGPSSGTNALRFVMSRDTVNLTIEVSPANLPFAAANQWCKWAVTFNAGAADAAQLLYGGDLRHPFTPVTTYVTQTVGSGTIGAEVAGKFRIGNTTTPATAGFPGQIALVAVWNTYFSQGDLNDFDLRRSPLFRSPLGYWLPGQDGTEVCRDLSGNNNHGAVTLAPATNDCPFLRSAA